MPRHVYIYLIQWVNGVPEEAIQYLASHGLEYRWVAAEEGHMRILFYGDEDIDAMERLGFLLTFSHLFHKISARKLDQKDSRVFLLETIDPRVQRIEVRIDDAFKMFGGGWVKPFHQVSHNSQFNYVMDRYHAVIRIPYNQTDTVLAFIGENLVLSEMVP